MHAVSAETGQTVWKYEQRAATMSLATTGGGLVFGGDVNGCFLELTPELRPSSGNNLFVFSAHRATPAHDGTAPPGLDVKPSDVASTLLAAARKLVRCAIRAGGWRPGATRAVGGHTNPGGPDCSIAGSRGLVDSCLKRGKQRGKHGWRIYINILL